MIEAKDLRIGNWFNYEDEPMQWEMDDFRNMEFDSVDCIWQPIPLTEEWLLKFGFDSNEWNGKFSANTMYWDKVDCILHIGDKRDTNYSFMAHCNYVHQFQNLYFALTNEELTIKDK